MFFWNSLAFSMILASKGSSSQGYGFSCGHVWMWELDCEEGWAPKNWCFWTVVLEKTLESPLDCNEIQSVHSEGDQPWDFFGRNDAKAETPVLWPRHAKSWLIGKDSDAGRDWGQEEKGTTEDETPYEFVSTLNIFWIMISFLVKTGTWCIASKVIYTNFISAFAFLPAYILSFSAYNTFTLLDPFWVGEGETNLEW